MLTMDIHQGRTNLLEHSQRHLHAIHERTAFTGSTDLPFQKQIILCLEPLLAQNVFDVLLVCDIKNSLHPQSLGPAAHVIYRGTTT